MRRGGVHGAQNLEQAMILLGFCVTSILLALCALHVFWAAGGQWGSGVAVPEVGGRPAFVPSKKAIVAVAVALLIAALIVLGRLGLWGTAMPRGPLVAGTWILAGIFLARAVGDFHLFGFSKQVRGTPFSFWDTWLFSPLCLGLGLGLLWIALH